MKRRDVLLGLGAGGLAACAHAPRITLGERTSAEVQVHRTPTGPRLRSSFLGLSFESSQLADPAFFSADNVSLLALLRRLAPDGVLRLGGNSSEFGVWQREASALAEPFRFAIRPADIDRLASFAEAAGWRVVYGINLGHGEPQRAADEAAYAMQRLGARLDAIQLGNEPDLYYRNGLRTPAYTAQNFITEWRRYADVIRARLPNVPLAGPDVAYRPEWIEAFTHACGRQVKFVSDHYYPTGPGNDTELDLDTLFRSEYQRYPQLQAVAQGVAAAGQRLRITEGNSVYNGGRIGVSDVFGATLWAAQLLFQLSRDGLDGMYFHGGAETSYSPLARDARSGVWSARPLYYALLFFAQAAPATLVDAQTQTGSRALRAHALLGDDGRLRLALINQHTLLPMDVRVTAEQPLSQASLLRLSASSMFSIKNVTLGGDGVDPRGNWRPQMEPVVIDNGLAYVTLAPASAMLVTLG